jgi:hypothetical protein
MLTRLTSELLDKFIIEIKNKPNLQKIQINLIDPLIDYTFQRLYPYVIVITIIFFLTFLLALSILVLVIKK